MINETSIFEGFGTLWSNRRASNVQSMDELQQLIVQELKDELTHPRLRKTAEEKLAIAMQRINESKLTNEVKHALSIIYEEQYNLLIK